MSVLTANEVSALIMSDQISKYELSRVAEADSFDIEPLDFNVVSDLDRLCLMPDMKLSECFYGDMAHFGQADVHDGHTQSVSVWFSTLAWIWRYARSRYSVRRQTAAEVFDKSDEVVFWVSAIVRHFGENVSDCTYGDFLNVLHDSGFDFSRMLYEYKDKLIMFDWAYPAGSAIDFDLSIPGRNVSRKAVMKVARKDKFLLDLVGDDSDRLVSLLYGEH